MLGDGRTPTQWALEMATGAALATSWFFIFLGLSEYCLRFSILAFYFTYTHYLKLRQ